MGWDYFLPYYIVKMIENGWRGFQELALSFDYDRMVKKFTMQVIFP